MCGLISCVVVVLGQLVGGLSPTTQVAGVLARGSAANWGGELVLGALRRNARVRLKKCGSSSDFHWGLREWAQPTFCHYTKVNSHSILARSPDRGPGPIAEVNAWWWGMDQKWMRNWWGFDEETCLMMRNCSGKISPLQRKCILDDLYWCEAACTDTDELLFSRKCV